MRLEKIDVVLCLMFQDIFDEKIPVVIEFDNVREFANLNIEEIDNISEWTETTNITYNCSESDRRWKERNVI